MLAVAAQYLQARSEEISRFWYLSAAFAVTIPLLIVGAIVWIFRDTFMWLLEETGFLLVLAAVAGGSGSLLSVIMRSGKLHFDSSVGRQLHYLESVLAHCGRDAIGHHCRAGNQGRSVLYHAQSRRSDVCRHHACGSGGRLKRAAGDLNHLSIRGNRAQNNSTIGTSDREASSYPRDAARLGQCSSFRLQF
jgi:hypothetical protein